MGNKKKTRRQHQFFLLAMDVGDKTPLLTIPEDEEAEEEADTAAHHRYRGALPRTRDRANHRRPRVSQGYTTYDITTVVKMMRVITIMTSTIILMMIVMLLLTMAQGHQCAQCIRNMIMLFNTSCAMNSNLVLSA
jgi:hypothetical protein